MITKTRITLVSLAVLALAACGGEPEHPRSAKDAADDGFEESPSAASIETSAEIGGLNEEEVTAIFEKAMPALQECLNRGAERIEFLGGEIAFLIKVGQDGHVVHAHAERTTLGDRKTERCMLTALSRQPWPKPVGGQVGLARNSFDFDMPNDVRAPVDWDAGQVAEVLDELSGELSGCKDGTHGEFTATMYVNDDGTALGVGVAPSEEDGETAVDCIAETLAAATYPSPGSWPAKVTFTL